MRTKLDVPLSETYPLRSELMDKAVNYLHAFWKQLFVYLNNSRYDIGYSIVECFIRPLVGEGKNLLYL